MIRRSCTLLAAAALLGAGLSAVPGVASAAPTHGERRVCAAPTKVGIAACDAHVRTVVGSDGTVRPDATSGPTGLSASQLQVAYGLQAAIAALGSTQHPKVAVVDAYASPNAAADLAVYRSVMGLPPVHSYTEHNQSGAVGNASWGQEEMLDLEMVSAACPACDIEYVGGKDASFAALGAAVDTAVADGAVVVSNSYGASEFNGELTYASHYNHQGVAITVSSGDSGYGVQVPAAYNTVTSVGGTSLTVDTTGNWLGEKVWSGAGSGCSAYVTKPGFQHDAGCSRRTVADVAAVADPATGVSVYDTYGSTGGSWYVFGGTSVAAPLIGGIYGLANNTSGRSSIDNAALPYTHTYGTTMHDVTTGTNTRRCRFGYLCSATTNYDGPTGNGTPIGTGSF